MRISYISKQLIPAGEEVRGKEIRKGIFEYISHPDFSEDNYISLSELNTFRRKYLTALIQSERIDSIRKRRTKNLGFRSNVFHPQQRNLIRYFSKQRGR